MSKWLPTTRGGYPYTILTDQARGDWPIIILVGESKEEWPVRISSAGYSWGGDNDYDLLFAVADDIIPTEDELAAARPFIEAEPELAARIFRDYPELEDPARQAAQDYRIRQKQLAASKIVVSDAVAKVGYDEFYGDRPWERLYSSENDEVRTAVSYVIAAWLAENPGTAPRTAVEDGAETVEDLKRKIEELRAETISLTNKILQLRNLSEESIDRAVEAWRNLESYSLRCVLSEIIAAANQGESSK